MKKVNTQNYIKKNIPSSKGAILVSIANKFTLPTKTFTGENCMNKLFKWIFEQQKHCNQIINDHFNKKLKMTLEDENNYQNLQDCWICNENLDKEKLTYHCHVTGKYRGAAHSQCNLKLKIPKKLPIIFLNLEGYDGNIIFKELNNFDNIDIQVIPKTSERYMSIIINRNIIFLDSLQFCKDKLDNLASNLKNKDCKHLISEFPEDELKIFKRKDSYSYEWVDSYEKFN